ncbi:Fis family transcriptional regulator [Hydrogenophaga sp. YM1]|uniref:helix-turn-helix domain-containing protein n=1 Tax=Hydrogenophaga sp. YM1 TaxID=2806262 RepID=UPI0019587DC5|nr:helix-turn-helix domain-containing protein [Hydrogenophaga sp. YM1]QRR32465.1 Fis family transcriptional regulator [Hydrogenophaga sp. YM1]
MTPSSIFYTSHSERVELARRRYFEEGETPSGAISEAVFQSWARCQRLHAGPAGRVEFEPVTKSRAHLALQKNRSLIEAWKAELPQMEAMLRSTSCAAMLTDATGVLVGSTCAGRSHEHIMPVATRIGVNLSEEAVGTTAPGVVTRTGQPVSVIGGEHFFESVKVMHCSAAPIRDTHGRLAGVLDLSSEVMQFGFDAASVVGLFAASIENRLLVASSTDHLVVRMQVAPALLEAPTVGLIGIDGLGQMAWSNGVARRLLGMTDMPPDADARSVEAVLGVSLGQLLACLGDQAQILKLPSGLQTWIKAELHASDGHVRAMTTRTAAVPVPSVIASDQGAVSFDDPPIEIASEAPAMPIMAEARPSEAESIDRPQKVCAAESLREVDLDLIRRTLLECEGNVSRAAKKLRVSRGLIYRRLRQKDQAAS